jgi:hypothetical protein
LEEDRIQHELERDQEILEECPQRLEALSARQDQEILEEHQQRLEHDRVSLVLRLAEESLEECQQRLEHNMVSLVQQRDRERLEQQQIFAVEGLDMSPETLRKSWPRGENSFSRISILV